LDVVISLPPMRFGYPIASTEKRIAR